MYGDICNDRATEQVLIRGIKTPRTSQGLTPYTCMIISTTRPRPRTRPTRTRPATTSRTREISKIISIIIDKKKFTIITKKKTQTVLIMMTTRQQQ